MHFRGGFNDCVCGLRGNRSGGEVEYEPLEEKDLVGDNGRGGFNAGWVGGQRVARKATGSTEESSRKKLG